MSQVKGKSRGVAECENCGAISVVTVWPDGSIVPIGTEKDGKCGDAEFTLIEGPSEP
jgi:hypothetical protein